MTEQPDKPLLYICADGGRIGNFWWVNSNLIPMNVKSIFLVPLLAVRWGTCGFGFDMTLKYEPISTLTK